MKARVVEPRGRVKQAIWKFAKGITKKLPKRYKCSCDPECRTSRCFTESEYRGARDTSHPHPLTDDKHSPQLKITVAASTKALLENMISGSTDSYTPIRPLHTTFQEFLMDESSSGNFFVERTKAQQRDLVSCRYICNIK
ncbi:hypothetical protein EV424DRAFT_1544297 [Suillus variegatus]|nr:hypothetical protein EV424DRAFT_1544297 [Suillus variegatus]